MDDILKSAWGDLLNENEKLAAILDEKDAEIERLEELLRGTGANRYWEGRWRDEVARIERMEAALQDIAEDPYAIDGGAAEIARATLAGKSHT